tara:strand:- start:15 stop:551 length:537 start_codon:yes stop_codon:yes gene_type:complete
MGTLKEQLNRTKELMGVLNEQEKQKPIKFKQYIGAIKDIVVNGYDIGKEYVTDGSVSTEDYEKIKTARVRQLTPRVKALILSIKDNLERDNGISNSEAIKKFRESYDNSSKLILAIAKAVLAPFKKRLFVDGKYRVELEKIIVDSAGNEQDGLRLIGMIGDMLGRLGIGMAEPDTSEV